MITLGWFSPISERTGIASYSKNVLTEMKNIYKSDQVKVIVFHPPTGDKTVEMPYPCIELTDSLLASDFDQLCDVAIYHIGNNEINHGPIYKALMSNPGVVILHDYVYQHYLAGVGLSNGFVNSSFASLVYSSGGAKAFNMLSESGVLRLDKGNALFAPWETSWATSVPLCDSLAALGLATVVHSDYSKKIISEVSTTKIKKLFLPRPSIRTSQTVSSDSSNYKIHLVCTGHIGPTKGLDLLMKAFNSNPGLKTKYRVTVAGFGSDIHYLEKLKSEILRDKLGNVFELVVGPDDEQLFSIMSEADVFYNIRYPNTEGASLSLVEQLSFSKPVIAYNTGCYAEVPQDACYFIDKINCQLSLASSLEEISEDRNAIKVKGINARKFVENNGTEDYVRQFVEFLLENRDDFEVKQGILNSRKTGDFKSLPKTENDWFYDFVKNKSIMQQYYDQYYLIPEGFWGFSPLEKGRYVSINILDSRVDDKNAERIGIFLEKDGLCKFHELFGKLVLISKMCYQSESLIPDYLLPLCIPVSDLNVWKILRQLDPLDGVSLAIHALNRKPDQDLIYHLQQDAVKQGFVSVVLEYIRGLQMGIADYQRLMPIINWLETHETNDVHLFDSLKTFPVDTDVIQHCQKFGVGESVLLQGFREVEEVGIWSGSKSAFIVLKSEEKITELAGDCSLFHWNNDSGQQVTIVVESLDSGLMVEHEVAFTTANDLQKTWSIEVAPITGVIIVRVKVDKLLSPASCIGSEDTRDLGVLISSLEMRGLKKSKKIKDKKLIN